MDNTASKKQIEKKAEKIKFQRDQELNDILIVLSTVEGRRFYDRIVNKICHYDKDDFNNSGSITFRSLGERNIGRVLKSDACEASLELYQKAEKENWEFLNKEKK